jgi:hypothetical protein
MFFKKLARTMTRERALLGPLPSCRTSTALAFGLSGQSGTALTKTLQSQSVVFLKFIPTSSSSLCRPVFKKIQHELDFIAIK